MKLHLEQSEPQQGVQKSRKVRRSQSWAKAKEKLVLVAVNNLLRSSVIISSSYFGFCRLLKRTWLHMMRYIRKYISKLHVVIVFMGAELSVVVNRIKSSIMQPFPVSCYSSSASFLLKHPSCRFCFLCRRSRDCCSIPSDTSILPPLSQHPHRLNQAQLSESACQH